MENNVVEELGQIEPNLKIILKVVQIVKGRNRLGKN